MGHVVKHVIYYNDVYTEPLNTQENSAQIFPGICEQYDEIL